MVLSLIFLRELPIKLLGVMNEINAFLAFKKIKSIFLSSLCPCPSAKSTRPCTIKHTGKFCQKSQGTEIDNILLSDLSCEAY